MKLQLDNEWSIESDAYAFKLCYLKQGRINKKTGKQVITAIETFHPNLEQALIWYMDNCIKSCDDAKTILKKLEEVKNIITELKLDRYTVATLRHRAVGQLSPRS